MPCAHKRRLPQTLRWTGRECVGGQGDAARLVSSTIRPNLPLDTDAQVRAPETAPITSTRNFVWLYIHRRGI